MKKLFLTAVFCLFLAHFCHADLLTSFTDDFNRDSLGDNYNPVPAGSKNTFSISDNAVLETKGPTQNLHLNEGTLPTEEDYAAGYRFSASIDIFIPDAGQAEVVSAGILLNGQDKNNFMAVRFRGHSASDARLQLISKVFGQIIPAVFPESKTMGTLASNTWYTLKVSSSAVGVYEYTFSQRDSNRPILEDVFKAENPLAGGDAGIFSSDFPSSSSVYQFDNFSVTVEKGAPAVEKK